MSLIFRYQIEFINLKIYNEITCNLCYKLIKRWMSLVPSW